MSDERSLRQRRQQIVEDSSAPRRPGPRRLWFLWWWRRSRRRHPRIADRVVELGAQTRAKSVAEVRSVIELSDDQQTRLAAALKSATGKDVEIKVVVDASVMGGLLVQIEDEVIDGTVRTRLKQLREAF